MPVKVQFERRESIWRIVEGIVTDWEECLEIKKILGTSLVDETVDLHTEVRCCVQALVSYQTSLRSFVTPA